MQKAKRPALSYDLEGGEGEGEGEDEGKGGLHLLLMVCSFQMPCTVPWRCCSTGTPDTRGGPPVTRKYGELKIPG